MTKLELPKLEEQIQKTGFVLENAVAQELKATGWTVMSNRYYLDDTDDKTVREMDLVAYRVGVIRDIKVFTTLVLSCKKSESDAWALLSRPLDRADPNADWWPVHAWSNDKAVRFEIDRPGAARRFHDDAARFGVSEALRMPEAEVFAFQEMDRRTGTVHNDKNIFNATTSLMKAQSYEMTSLPLRRKEPAVYQFNLISVVDADLVRLLFDGGRVTASEIDSEHYMARYIIRKQTTVSRIRFVRASKLKSVLPDYEKLHVANCRWITAADSTFYAEALKDAQRTAVLLDEFRDRAAWFVSYRAKQIANVSFKPEEMGIEWRESDGRPAVTVPLFPKQLEALNADEESRAHVAGSLERVYRYRGDFFFDTEEIPF